MNFNTIKHQEDTYLMNTYGRFQVSLVKGKNATAYDCDNRKYIDFTAGIGVNCLGWGNEKWAEAVSQQAKELSHTSNLYYNPKTAELAEKLCTLTGFKKVFFGNSGAEANECAIKVARKYSSDKYSDKRSDVLTLKNSFHGRTLATLAATGQKYFHELFQPLPLGFDDADADFESVKNAITENTCAVMFECIQGEGGVIPLNKEFLQKLRVLCNEKDILMIDDEVQTGIGRTGTFYSYEQFGIKPDIVTNAKGLGGGLPIGACLANEKCADSLGASEHGSTFGGNPVVCAGAIEVLNQITEEGFLDSVKEKGNYLRKSLENIDGIQSVRGLGMMLGAKPKSDKSVADLAAECVEHGLLILTAKNVLRFLPPLTITKEELDEGIDILRKILNK